mmetsp:Transcript_139142/g.245882  ORF Transcript_139142/g.245882 Transcript_139142/m.245882 type:complete len:176 (-) Transcript_139142:154-681(-)
MQVFLRSFAWALVGIATAVRNELTIHHEISSKGHVHKAALESESENSMASKVNLTSAVHLARFHAERSNTSRDCPIPPEHFVGEVPNDVCAMYAVCSEFTRSKTYDSYGLQFGDQDSVNAMANEIACRQAIILKMWSKYDGVMPGCKWKYGANRGEFAFNEWCRQEIAELGKCCK